MSFFTNIVKNVKEFYSEINGATLTGAIDVIVVEQEDGTFKSTPFHVRFGKMGVLKAKEKIVDLEINGEPIEIQMKLDDTGAAFFVEDVAKSDESLLADLATSPIQNQTKFDWKERKLGILEPKSLFNISELKYDEKIPKIVPNIEELNNIQNDDNDEMIEPNMKEKQTKKKKRRRNQLRFSQKGSKTCLTESIETLTDYTDDMFDMDDVNDADLQNGVEWPKINASNSSVHFADEETDIKKPENILENPFIAIHDHLNSGYTSEPDPSEKLLIMGRHEVFRPKSVSSGFNYFPKTAHASSENLLTLDLEEMRESEEQNVWRWGELPKAASYSTVLAELEKSDITEQRSKTKDHKKNSWFSGWSAQPKPKEETIGVYLDDIADNPELLSIYLSPTKTEQSDPLEVSDINQTELTDTNDTSNCTSLIKNENQSYASLGNSQTVRSSNVTGRLDSGCESESSFRNSDSELCSIFSKYLPDLAVSMCGGLADASITPDQFELHILEYSQFLEKLRAGPASLLADSNLVIRMHDKYIGWDKAAPILLSLLLFKQPLPFEAVSELTKDCLNVNVSMTPEDMSKIKMEDKKSNSWFGWFSADSEEENQLKTGNSTEPMINGTEGNDKQQGDTQCHSTSSEDSDTQSDKKSFRKSLRLTSERLVELKLKSGSNEVEFSVTTAFQGTTRCKCHIYLWHHTDKVVISDIDGTITKSDVLGHILPVIGRDWAQSGVAQLFTKIRNNGYHIMYLTARALGQASITKDYLQSVKQGDVCLPDGPLFLNPDSLMHAFKREVIDRNPEEFKIRCLRDVQSLFEEKNPFFAGYGNRPNDAFAYRAVGIPVSRIFTINPAGELKHELTQNFQTS